MAGVDRIVKHYKVDRDTGERTINTDVNIFVVLNAVAYLCFLILVFTIGAFGSVRSTTNLLADRFKTVVTPESSLFLIAWGIIVPWQALWILWPIIVAKDRNCEGVVNASYFYPFAIILYFCYTLACRYDYVILGTVFAWALCATMVGLVMSIQRYRSKMLPGYMIWQGHLSLFLGIIIVETCCMTNIVFVVLEEEWIVKVLIGAVSLITIFLTAIAWLSSYPVDLLVPLVLGIAVGTMYLEQGATFTAINLGNQGYSDRWREGARYVVLAIFILIFVSLFLKILVVLLHQRPRDQAERQKRKDNRVSLTITIDPPAKPKSKSRAEDRLDRLERKEEERKDRSKLARLERLERKEEERQEKKKEARLERLERQEEERHEKKKEERLKRLEQNAIEHDEENPVPRSPRPRPSKKSSSKSNNNNSNKSPRPKSPRKKKVSNDDNAFAADFD